MEFAERTEERLGIRAWGRVVMEAGDSFDLREPFAACNSDLAGKSAGVRIEKPCSWSSYLPVSGGSSGPTPSGLGLPACGLAGLGMSRVPESIGQRARA